MGYAFHVAAVTIGPATSGSVPVKIEVENRGVAPFYHDWRPELALLPADGVLGAPTRLEASLIGILPGAPARVWEGRIKAAAPGGALLLRVPNPMPGGRPVRFANAAQDADRDGWLTLGQVIVGR
jgi:hypothetical protein